MRHRYFGKKLSRTTSERRRLFMVLSRQLIAHGKVVTTVTRAKAVAPIVEKLITSTKKGTDAAKRQVMRILSDVGSIEKLRALTKTRFAGRTSGYTRIVRVGNRGGDNAEEALLTFVDEEKQIEKKPVEKKVTKKPRKRSKV